MKLEKTLRWFGHSDPVSLAEIRQTGVTGVVTALHEVPNGAVWPKESIREVCDLVNKHNLSWHVVESLPVHHQIKAGLQHRDEYIDHYIQSLKNLADFGIDTVCYNFMPVLDWVRTDLNYPLPGLGITMQYDHILFAAFDIFILQRPQAEKDYQPEIRLLAEERYQQLSDEQADDLARTIILVTQGFIDGFSAQPEMDYKKQFLNYLREYQNIDREKLREHLGYFLDAVIPEAEQVGINLAIHADDPAFPVMGLPRIVSTNQDLEWIFNRQPAVANGLTFCTGSFSTNKDNNLPAMAQAFRDRIHFLHLRNTQYLNDYVFIESGHLEGDVNMVEIIQALQDEDRIIPMRPDHGIKILEDQQRNTNPGYPLLGRLKGLSEISGLATALLHLGHEKS